MKYFDRVGLWITNFSSMTNFTASPSYDLLLDVIETAKKRNIFLYIYSSINKSKYDNVVHGLKDLQTDNTKIHIANNLENQKYLSFSIEESLLKIIKQLDSKVPYYFNFVVNEREGISPLLHVYFNCYNDKQMNIFNLPQYIISAFEKKKLYLKWIHVSSFLSSYNVFESDQHYKTMRDKVLKSSISPSAMLEFEKKSKVIPLGINTKRLDRIRKEKKEGKALVVCFTHKLYNLTGVWALEIMKRLYMTGKKDVDYRVYTPSKNALIKFKTSMYKKYDGLFSVYHSLDKNIFLNLASEVDIYFSPSKHEDFSITTIEHIYLGALPVLPDLDWARNIVGDEYPYLVKFNDNEEMYEGFVINIKYLLNNYWKEYNKWMPYLRDRIKKKFDREIITNNLFDYILDKERNGFVHSSTNSILDLVKDVVESYGDNEFTMKQLFEDIRKNSKIKVDFSKWSEKVGLTKNDIFKYVTEVLGYKVSVGDLIWKLRK